MSEPQYDSIQQVRGPRGNRLFFNGIPAGLHLSSSLAVPTLRRNERLMVVVNLPESGQFRPVFVGLGLYGVAINRTVRPLVPFVAVATSPSSGLISTFQTLAESPNSFFVGHRLFEKTFKYLKAARVDVGAFADRSTDLWQFATDLLDPTLNNRHRNLSTERHYLFSAATQTQPKLHGIDRFTEIREDQPHDIVGGRWNELFHDEDAAFRSRPAGNRLTIAEQFLISERDINTDATLVSEWLRNKHVQYEQAVRNEDDDPYLVKGLDEVSLKQLTGELPQTLDHSTEGQVL